MKIISLNLRPEIEENQKLSRAYNQFEKLIGLLNTREIPSAIVEQVSLQIENLNTIPDKDLKGPLRKNQTKIIQLIEKELKIVPKLYYRNIWLAIGMTAIGMPIGVCFGLILKNMAFIGIGLPIGLAVGVGIGTKMDKKAFEEGRQLDLELK
jgi:hypothetical protein